MRQSKKQKPFSNRMDRDYVLLRKKADFDMGDKKDQSKSRKFQLNTKFIFKKKISNKQLYDLHSKLDIA